MAQKEATVEKIELGRRILEHLPYEPNQQQIQLIAALARYCAPDDPTLSRSEDRAFLLNGYAGTGKTSVIGALVKALGEYGVPVVLLAPTGRAAKVLSAACSHPAYTIHRRIYRGDSASPAGYLPIVNENRLTDAVFIVDEASMIANDSNDGSNLLRDLVHYVFSGAGCRLILLGDGAQLPPVGYQESPAMNPETLRDMGLKTSRAVITAPARQKGTSGILYNATRQRIAMGADPIPAPVIYASPFRDVRVVDDPEELAEMMESDYYNDGAGETIIITRSNRRATEFNKDVRRRILGYEEEIVKGERLLVVKNNYLWSKEVKGLDFIANGDVAVVEKIIGIEDRYTMRFADVELSMPDHGVTFRCKIMLDTLVSLSAGLDDDYEQLFQQSILTDPDLFTPTMTLEQRRRTLKNNPYYNALRVKYGYCVTCHKAQGGQWRNVYIDMGYIHPESTGLELYRWLYTATTRATRRVTFISPIFEVK